MDIKIKYFNNFFNRLVLIWCESIIPSTQGSTKLNARYAEKIIRVLRHDSPIPLKKDNRTFSVQIFGWDIQIKSKIPKLNSWEKSIVQFAFKPTNSWIKFSSVYSCYDENRPLKSVNRSLTNVPIFVIPVVIKYRRPERPKSFENFA